MYASTANDEPAAEHHEHAAADTSAGKITLLYTNACETYRNKGIESFLFQ